MLARTFRSIARRSQPRFLSTAVPEHLEVEYSVRGWQEEAVTNVEETSKTPVVLEHIDVEYSVRGWCSPDEPSDSTTTYKVFPPPAGKQRANPMDHGMSRRTFATIATEQLKKAN